MKQTKCVSIERMPHKGTISGSSDQGWLLAKFDILKMVFGEWGDTLNVWRVLKNL